MNKYVGWFVSAIRGSKKEDLVDSKTLVLNCKSCFSQVRKTMKSNEEELINMFEDFKERTSFILLLCSSPVAPHLEQICNSDTANLLKSVPTISIHACLNVMQSVKSYKFLHNILPLFTTSLIYDIYKEFPNCDLKMVPVSLAIHFEMLIGIVLSLKCSPQQDSESVKYFFDAYKQFLQKTKFDLNKEEEVNIFGYYYLYLVESLNILLKYQLKLNSYIPLTLGKIFLKDFNYSHELESSDETTAAINATIKTLVELCHLNMSHISANIWIDWHDNECPVSCLYSSHVSHIDSKITTLQKLLSYSIYNMLQCIEKHCDTRQFILSNFQDLKSFLNSVAADPAHDPDDDLTIEELINLINNNESKKKKAIGILISKNIFNSSDALECVKSNEGLLSDKSESILICLQNLIAALNAGNAVIEEWKRVILMLSKQLDGSKLLEVIRHLLDNGKNNCLKTDNFLSDVTQVFNTVADSNNERCKLTNLYIWLCLQSGLDAVLHSVNMIMSMSGLTSIITAALKEIFFVCKVKVSDVSYLVGVLRDNLLSDLTDQTEMEVKELCVGLLSPTCLSAGDGESNSVEIDLNMLESLPICPNEVLVYIVHPLLVSSNRRGVNSKCIIAIDILNVMVKYHLQSITLVGPNISALLMTLYLLHHNCCYLSKGNIQSALPIRKSVQNIIERIICRIKFENNQYCKEISLLNQLLSSYQLNIGSEMLISSLESNRNIDQTDNIDQLYQNIVLFFLNRGKVKKTSYNDIEKFLTSNCVNRTTWIYLFYTLLPSSSEEEWLSCIFLNNLFISCSGHSLTILSSLKLSFNILNLIAKSYHNSADKENSISLHHCFKCFSGSSMKFIRLHTCDMEVRRKFITLQDIFLWWCCSLSIDSFKGFEELPLIFLSSLVNEMSEIVHSGGIEISLGVNGNDNLITDTPPLSILDEDLFLEISVEESTYSEDDISVPNLLSSLSRSIKYFTLYSFQCKITASIANKMKCIFEALDDMRLVE